MKRASERPKVRPRGAPPEQEEEPMAVPPFPVPRTPPGTPPLDGADGGNTEYSGESMADAEERKESHDQMEKALHQLGLSNKIINAISNLSYTHVAEVYSPPRVIALADKFKLTPGCALDLTKNDPGDGKPWDFTKPDKRARAVKLLSEDKPFVLVGSPPCTPFSVLFRSSASRMDPIKRHKAIENEILHLNFCCALYKIQIEEGRYFLHDHPQSASSWNV